jgi:hypothetical protein
MQSRYKIDYALINKLKREYGQQITHKLKCKVDKKIYWLRWNHMDNNKQRIN